MRRKTIRRKPDFSSGYGWIRPVLSCTIFSAFSTNAALAKKEIYESRSNSYSIESIDLDKINRQLLRSVRRRSLSDEEKKILQQMFIDKIKKMNRTYQRASKLSVQASKLTRERKFEQAIEIYTSILKMKDLVGSGRYLLKRGECYEKMGRMTDAITDYSDGIEQSSAYRHNFRERLSSVYSRLGEMDKALEQLDISIKEENGGFLAPFDERAQLNLKLGKAARAVEDFTRSIENYKAYYKKRGYKITGDGVNTRQTANLGFLYRDRASAYIEEKQYKKAIEDLIQAGKYTYKILQNDLRISLVRAYRLAGEKELAEKNAKELISKLSARVSKRGTAEAYHNRSLIYAGLDMPEKALSDMNRALELKPDYADYYYQTAGIKSRMKDHEGALELVSRAIDLNSYEKSYFLLRAELYLKRKKYKQALADLDKAEKLDQDWPPLYDLRGRVYEKTGDAVQAERNKQKARLLGFEPEDPCNHLIP